MLSRWARLVKPPCTDLLCHISPFRVVSCVFWGVGSWTQNTIQGVCTGLCVCMFVSEYKAAAGNGLLYLLALCWNHDLKSRSFCEVIPFSTSHLLKWNALKNHDKKKKNNNNNNNGSSQKCSATTIVSTCHLIIYLAFNCIEVNAVISCYPGEGTK